MDDAKEIEEAQTIAIKALQKEQNTLEDLIKFIKEKKEYYSDGSMCSISESILGEQICEDILKRFEGEEKMSNLTKVSESEIMKILGEHFGVRIDGVTLHHDYEFVIKNGDKVRHDFIYAIIDDGYPAIEAVAE